MISIIAPTVKVTLYRGGVLGGYHRWRNRRRLTVVMFHRVLDERDPRWDSADPAWTISQRLFADCLDFFRTHYRVIGIPELLLACERSRPLPERPLLITFDDGWADNAEYALPCLQAAGLPAAVFVAVAGVGQAELWNERLGRASRTGLLTNDKQRRLWDAMPDPEVEPVLSRTGHSALWDLTVRLSSLEETARQHLLTDVLADEPPAAPYMLSLEQLRELHGAGVMIGAHGLTHSPIPATADPLEEVSQARCQLAAMLGEPHGPVAFSFPHGIYDQCSLQNAFRVGYRVVFHSDPFLTDCPRGFPRAAVFGRIPIYADAVTDSRGGLARERLASWLFLRPGNRSNSLSSCRIQSRSWEQSSAT